MDHCKIQL